MKILVINEKPSRLKRDGSIWCHSVSASPDWQASRKILLDRILHLRLETQNDNIVSVAAIQI